MMVKQYELIQLFYFNSQSGRRKSHISDLELETGPCPIILCSAGASNLDLYGYRNQHPAIRTIRRTFRTKTAENIQTCQLICLSTELYYGVVFSEESKLCHLVTSKGVGVCNRLSAARHSHGYISALSYER